MYRRLHMPWMAKQKNFRVLRSFFGPDLMYNRYRGICDSTACTLLFRIYCNMSEFLIKEIQENPEVQKDFVEYMHERDKELVPLFDEFQTQINNFNIKSLEEFAA